MKRCLMFVMLSFAGCKQGVGDRCQINDDCGTDSSGVPLLCNAATGTCQDMNQGGIDALVIDAPVIDASVDAPSDAPSDAPHD